MQRLDDYDSDVDEPDPDILYRIINTPIPNFKNLLTIPTNAPQWKGWWKFGAISAAAISTTTSLATWAAVAIRIYNYFTQQL